MTIGSEKRRMTVRSVLAEVEKAGVIMMIKLQTLGPAIEQGVKRNR